MILNQRVLAVIPARSGSKGLLKKNLRTFFGVPLVAQVGHVICGVPAIDRAVVSTDSEEIAAAARTTGIDAPFLRPKALSGDSIGDVDVLVHALEATEHVDGCIYGIVVMLQPTSPLRTALEVTECLDLYARNKADSVWTISLAEKKYHPLKALTVADGQLAYFDARGPDVIARQQLGDVYYRNGACYVLSRKLLLERRSLMGERTFAYISDNVHVSVDSAEDLALAESLELKRRQSSRDLSICEKFV